MDPTRAATQIIDLGAGAPRQLFDLTLPIAWRYFFLSAIAAYVLEAFGKSPTEPRDYGATTWRVVVVLVLLASYQTVFGAVVNLASDLAAQVAPEAVAGKLGSDLADHAKSYWDLQTDLASDPLRQGATGTVAGAIAQGDSLVGSMFFKASIGLVSVLGLVAHRVVAWLAGVLIALCYVLGPLALVFSIPRQSGIGTRWFAEFVSFCTWPIISGVMVSLVAAVGVHTNGDLSKGLEAIAMSLVLMFSAVATPVLARRFIGGGVSQAVGHGFQTASGIAGGVRNALAAARGGGQAGTGGAAGTAQASPATSNSPPANPPGGSP